MKVKEILEVKIIHEKEKLYIFVFQDGHEEREYGLTAGDAFRKLGYSIADSDQIETYYAKGENK